jgi:hypothetical protein
VIAGINERRINKLAELLLWNLAEKLSRLSCDAAEISALAT